MSIFRPFCIAAALTALTVSTPALAWGNVGHQTIALIARSRLTPAVRARVDALLATDPDTLTAPDMASRATWADAWRGHGHRETAQWHFADVELDAPDLASACFAFSPADGVASTGTAQDCVTDKVEQFSAELADPATSEPERERALVYLLHFVGDMHQPLHASDNHDRGGNCVRLVGAGQHGANLHAYWDTAVVEAMDTDPARLAATLGRRITAEQARAWVNGSPRIWTLESFAVAKAVTYSFATPAGCDQNSPPVSLPPGYDAQAQAAAAVQLERAGVRLAYLINLALGDAGTILPSLAAPPTAGERALTSPNNSPASTPLSSAATDSAAHHSPTSLRCSAEADGQGLHGQKRQRFRRECLRRDR